MEVTNVPIRDLKPNDKNPRMISQNEMRKLMRSLEEFGFVDPIIVNKNKNRYNIVVGGHQRLRAAEKLGYSEVPVTYVDLTEDKEQLLNIALNEISGEWDDDKLLELLKELEERGADLTLSGFDEPLLDEILNTKEKAIKESSIDKTPNTPDTAKSRPGDIWILGKHRLMVGDSTKESDFDLLMKGEKGKLCWTDPPYGVSYEGKTGHGVLENDDLRDDKLYQFLFHIFKNVSNNLEEGSAVYTCYASINHIIFEKALNEAGINVKQQLIWSKGHVLGRSDYHWCHEPIMYCKRGEKNTPWYGDRTHKTVTLNATIEQLQDLKKEELIEMISKIRESSDIIEEKKDPHNEYVHSTQKPVSLSERMIKNSSRTGEIVIEPCSGSGSTIMACEKSGRRCFAMEIDPLYADVIVQRWTEYTGGNAFRESDEKKWKEL